jgi:hypothetical protein
MEAEEREVEKKHHRAGEGLESEGIDDDVEGHVKRVSHDENDEAGDSDDDVEGHVKRVS